MDIYFAFLFGVVIGGMSTVLDIKKNGLERGIARLFVLACLLIIAFIIGKTIIPEKGLIYLALGLLILLFLVTDKLTVALEKLLKHFHIKLI